MQGNAAENRVKPFQAQYEQVYIRKQLNGHILEEKITGTVSRDPHGRERTEEWIESESGEPLGTVLVYDPVDRMRYIVDVKSNSVLDKYVTPDGSVRAQTWGLGESRVAIPLTPPERQPDLGSKEIEGLLCEGYQTKGPGEAVSEYWFSRDLNQVMFVLITGENEKHLWRLFNIHQTEPDSQLFIVHESS
jgi:hypothetical protein